MKRREVARAISHFSPIETIAHRAGYTAPLSRGLDAHVLFRVTRQRGPCRLQIEQPVEEKVQLLRLIGMTDFEGAAGGRDFLDVLPERRECPLPREERLPAVEFRPTEIANPNPREHRSMNPMNHVAACCSAIEKIDDGLTLLRQKSCRPGESRRHIGDP